MADRLMNILNEYSNRLRELLNDNLIGVYVTGSVALNGYHDDKSDIDFTVLMRKPLDSRQISELEVIHKNLLEKYPKNVLEGHYITIEELGRSQDEINPVVTYYEGRLSNSYHGIVIVTWFTLKKYGITIWGTPVKDLIFDAPLSELLSYVICNVNTYWTNWVSRTKRVFSLKKIYALTSVEVEWGVLGISRMYYTLSENDIASKDKAGEYALKHMPEEYHKIIQEALYIRSGKGRRQYNSPFKRCTDMIEFMEYMIIECNKNR